MPTSRGGTEERAAGGGAVVPGRQVHAVAEDHPASGGDGPAWGLAAAAAAGHGLQSAQPAAGAGPSHPSGLVQSRSGPPRPRPPLPPLGVTPPGICSSSRAAATPTSPRAECSAVPPPRWVGGLLPTRSSAPKPAPRPCSFRVPRGHAPFLSGPQWPRPVPSGPQLTRRQGRVGWGWWSGSLPTLMPCWVGGASQAVRGS